MPDPTPASAAAAATPFHDLDQYVALPRLTGLTLSPYGERLVVSVETPNPKGTGYVSALWSVDPAGERPAYRLTRSAKGEAGAAIGPSGDVYFVSARPDPGSTDGAGDDAPAALWQLPAGGGDARPVVTRLGGVAGVLAARAADVVVATVAVMPGAASEDDDEAIRKQRKEHEVRAILHQAYPIRYWDHDLGPGEPHLHAVEPQAAGSDEPAPLEPRLGLRDLTPDVGPRLNQQEATVSPDGTFVLTGITQPMAAGDHRTVLARVDVATGQRRVLADDPARDFSPGPVSPDGTQAIVIAMTRPTPGTAPRLSIALLDTVSGDLTELAPGWDRWPHPMAWLPDGSAVLVVADDGGRSPVFRVAVPSGEVTAVTHDDAAYTDVVVAPDGVTAYALRSSYAFPPEPVRIDLASGEVTRLPSPAERPELPGRLTEVAATAADGAPVRSWLALPSGAGADHPAPLVLWIHGGPLSSWNSWSWRWCPWLLVAAGYAVLLPDPALSTGYGQSFVQRGWGRWGSEPFTDLMAATDAAVAREDIDAERTAAMGGSFGGYMANWVAGHTDRFRAIVTHASLWALDQFAPTTDNAAYWLHEMTPEMAAANSPHRSAGSITTPMLVVHGDQDYRVPIGEGLRLWWELLSASGLPADADGASPHRFLYFPDENHWVLRPQHAKVWYGVVLHFLATHLTAPGTAAVPPAAVPPLPADLGLTAPAPLPTIPKDPTSG